MGDLSYMMLAAAMAVTFGAGFVKGAVGFALPMIMISALGSFLAPQIALAAVILPTLLSNLWQALRHGWRAALASVWNFRLYLFFMLFFIAFSAQLVAVLPQSTLLLLIGVPVTFFALVQLLGTHLHLRQSQRWLAEPLIGAGAGFVGGLSGVWGPPLVVFLTALGTDKREQMRIQGVVYGLGAVVLAGAHLGSGVLNAATLPLSALLVVPTLAGMALGLMLHERMPQAAFRRGTLLVLVVAGLNLIRRAVWAG